MSIDVDRTGQIGFCLNAVSRDRIERLARRAPEVLHWPSFSLLHLLLQSVGDSAGPVVTAEHQEFDALFALLQIFNAEPELGEASFDVIAETFVSKIRNKGGASCALTQIPDIAYEMQVSILLARLMPGFAAIEKNDNNRPDHVFSVRFERDNAPCRVAIECKNIQRGGQELRDLVRSVARAIGAAASQHSGRTQEFSDLIIFIDLPRSVIHEDKQFYLRLIVNVWDQLTLAGVTGVDESQVIFTTTGQKGMIDYVLNTNEQASGLLLMRPVVLVNKKEILMRSPRMVFLSMLMRDPNDPPNIENWWKCALPILAPESYRLPID